MYQKEPHKANIAKVQPFPTIDFKMRIRDRRKGQRNNATVIKELAPSTVTHNAHSNPPARRTRETHEMSINPQPNQMGAKQ